MNENDSTSKIDVKNGVLLFQHQNLETTPHETKTIIGLQTLTQTFLVPIKPYRNIISLSPAFEFNGFQWLIQFLNNGDTSKELEISFHNQSHPRLYGLHVKPIACVDKSLMQMFMTNKITLDYQFSINLVQDHVSQTNRLSNKLTFVKSPEIHVEVISAEQDTRIDVDHITTLPFNSNHVGNIFQAPTMKLKITIDTFLRNRRTSNTHDQLQHSSSKSPMLTNSFFTVGDLSINSIGVEQKFDRNEQNSTQSLTHFKKDIEAKQWEVDQLKNQYSPERMPSVAQKQILAIESQTNKIASNSVEQTKSLQSLYQNRLDDTVSSTSDATSFNNVNQKASSKYASSSFLRTRKSSVDIDKTNESLSAWDNDTNHDKEYAFKQLPNELDKLRIAIINNDFFDNTPNNVDYKSNISWNDVDANIIEKKDDFETDAKSLKTDIALTKTCINVAFQTIHVMESKLQNECENLEKKLINGDTIASELKSMNKKFIQLNKQLEIMILKQKQMETHDDNKVDLYSNYTFADDIDDNINVTQSIASHPIDDTSIFSHIDEILDVDWTEYISN